MLKLFREHFYMSREMKEILEDVSMLATPKVIPVIIAVISLYVIISFVILCFEGV